MDLETAYKLGKDCGINGANTKNSHFSIFSSPGLLKAWENGKHDASVVKDDAGGEDV